MKIADVTQIMSKESGSMEKNMCTKKRGKNCAFVEGLIKNHQSD